MGAATPAAQMRTAVFTQPQQLDLRFVSSSVESTSFSIAAFAVKASGRSAGGKLLMFGLYQLQQLKPSSDTAVRAIS